MALSIPTLLSPVGVNNVIVKDEENGYFCSTAEEWKSRLEQLLNDEQLRKKIGSAGRKKVQENYSVQSQKQSYLALFQ